MAAKPRIWFTSLHRAEWMHAVSQHVFRKEITALEARRVQTELERDIKSGLWVTVDMPESVWDICSDLARRHGARLGIRTLDSLHVATAVKLGAKAFWTFDERQAKLAAVEGLPSF
jgi:predicted nucleic acid-binding protein